MKLYVEGMECRSCEEKVKRAVESIKGVRGVDVKNPKVIVIFKGNSTKEDTNKVIETIEGLGYKVRTRESIWIRNILSLLAVVLLFFVLRQVNFGTSRITKDMGYVSIFLAGLFGSVHCVGMCGGFCITASKGKTGSIFYNLGRLVSYTCMGAIFGGIGSVLFQIDGADVVIKILVGLFMIVVALSMMGMVRLPKIKTLEKVGSPFTIGLLNGLMPCGLLTIAWAVAAASGSVLSGGLTMACFCLGTMPLMLCLGSLSGSFQKFHAVYRVLAVFVAVFGLLSISQGFSLAGVGMPTTSNEATATSKDSGNVQKIESQMENGRYPDIEVEKGKEVEWTIIADEGDLTSCNYVVEIPEYGIEKELEVGKNTITFTPTKSGTYTYSCYMGMLTGTITVS